MENLDDVTEVTSLPADTGQAELQSIISQNERLIEIAEEQYTVNSYSLVALLLVVSVLGIVVGQLFVRIFKR